MSATSNRYRYVVDVDEETCQESALFKRLAYEVVFLSPELKQLEHKGNYILERLWDVLKARYIEGKEISGQDFQLLPDEEQDAVQARDDAADQSLSREPQVVDRGLARVRVRGSGVVGRGVSVLGPRGLCVRDALVAPAAGAACGGELNERL